MKTIISTEVIATHNNLSINVKQDLIMVEGQESEPSVIRIKIVDPMSDGDILFHGGPASAERLIATLDKALDIVTDQFAEGV